MGKELLFVGIGGALGSMLRYLTSVWTSKFYSAPFPLATLLANVIGCLIIGILMGYFNANSSDNSLKLLWITGFCGGYTTFSSFAAENLILWQNHQYLTLGTYTVASLVLGITALIFGLNLSR